MLNIVSSNRFKKDLKLAIRRGYNISLLEEVVNKLLSVYEDADREVVEKDVALFIERLEKDNIIE